MPQVEKNLEVTMKRVLILSVSAIAVLATSQAFARDDIVTNKTTTKLNVVIPQKVYSVGTNRATDSIKKTGGLSGVGVPGGLGSRGPGSDIARGTGFKDTGISAKSVLGSAKDGVNKAKDQANQSKGVQIRSLQISISQSLLGDFCNKIGTNLPTTEGQSMSALRGYIRHQLVLLS
jgi:hypothetical protein